jgi:hypothetical protein
MAVRIITATVAGLCFAVGVFAQVTLMTDLVEGPLYGWFESVVCAVLGDHIEVLERHTASPVTVPAASGDAA